MQKYKMQEFKKFYGINSKGDIINFLDILGVSPKILGCISIDKPSNLGCITTGHNLSNSFLNLALSFNCILSNDEYYKMIDYAYNLGIRNCFVQEEGTQKKSFIPDFSTQEF